MQKSLLNLPSPKSFLKSHHLFAKKRFGQNFLNNKNILNKIVDTANLTKEDTVLEIGPGLGSLTELLAEKAGHVLALEKDRDLIPILKEKFKHQPHVEIRNEDALRFDPPKTPYKIVANIPYYITSPLINHFLKDTYLKNSNIEILNSKQILNSKSQNPKLIVLLTQKEVAEKICAAPPNLNVLALNIQIFGRAKIIGTVSKGNFYPRPKVDSAILHIKPYDIPLINNNLEKTFQLISAGFNQKRKTLFNALKHNLKLPTEKIRKMLEDAKIDGDRRAETLTIIEWGYLAEKWHDSI